MSIDDVTEIINRGLYIVCITAAPVLLISLSVGLIVSIFQTVTSIQEQTLTFVPKVLAIFFGLIVFGNWMLTNMSEFMIGLWSDFSLYIR